jgi:hypothetical protein
MAGVNQYFRFSKISEAKFRSLLRCFALDRTATQTARMTGISLRNVNQIYLRLRKKLAQECVMNSPFAGELEKCREPYAVALVQIGLKQMQEAVKQLEQSYRNGSLWSLGFLSDPILASLRKEPLFQQFLSKISCPVPDNSDPLSHEPSELCL